jgi:hypothetical protein
MQSPDATTHIWAFIPAWDKIVELRSVNSQLLTTALPVMAEFYVAERWLPIRGFEGLYEVSDQGRVRSLDRVVMLQGHPKLKERTMRGRVLFQKTNRPAAGAYKRKQVSLWKDNRQHTMNVARLVAEAFIPNPDGAPFVLHLDDDATNNMVTNLEWGDHAENVRQMIERNRMPSGRQHHAYKHGLYANKG